MKKHKIAVDKEKCIGCTACWVDHPEFFKEDEDGKSVPVKTEVEDITPIKDAQKFCPTGAITIDGKS